MKATLQIDDELYHRASELTGIEAKAPLVHEALRALIAQESARRLAGLGGKAPNMKSPPRRRVSSAKRPASTAKRKRA